ncbi:olfactory receptor 12D1-like [Podarcis muralis]
MKNQTEVREFILTGLTNLWQLQCTLFVTFLMLYLASLLGNAAIVLVAIVEPKLHTPMYFFLGNLSCLDIFFTTTTVPKMLAGFLLPVQTISFGGCMAQLHFFHFLGSSEAILLGVMAFDRYVAICNPLRYSIIMRKQVCQILAAATWSTAFFHALMHAVATARLPFCGPNHIEHFFCEIKPLLKLALQSQTGRQKAFSTCGSHLMVVGLMYVPVLFNYMLPSVGNASQRDMMVTLIYSAVTPVLNPLIYTLRNQEVKTALLKILGRKFLTFH